MIVPCAHPMAMIPAFPMRTTGPVSIDLDDCADIELSVDDHGCTTLPDGILRITVCPLSVRNIGGSDTLSDFSVTAFAPGYSGSDSTTVSAPVASGGLVDLPALTFEIPAAVATDPACPITLRVVADSSFAVVECDEGNNTVEFEECCPDDGPGDERDACCFEDGSCAEMSEADCLVEGGTYEGAGTTCATVECPTEDECPDLTVQILNIACDCAQVPGTNFFGITGTVRVRVTNIGGAPTPLLVNGVSVSPGGDAATLLPLNPGNSWTHTLDISRTVTSCRGSAVTVTAGVDPNHDVDECNENNNTDTDSQDCSWGICDGG